MLKERDKTDTTLTSNNKELLTARLSNLAYTSIRKYKNNQKLFKDASLSSWEYFQPEAISAETKLKMFTAINNTTKELVIVLKGSEPIPSFDIESMITDWCISDIHLVIGKIPKQFYEAYSYLNTVKNQVPNDYKIFITGHSLGGSIVQLLCSLSENNEIIGYTYNPYGVKHLLPILEEENFIINSAFENINNFSINIDLVSNHNDHIGNIYIIKYKKTFFKTIFCIISELPKILTDIPFKIIKTIKYYFNLTKLFFIKMDAHFMNNFTSEFEYKPASKIRMK